MSYDRMYEESYSYNIYTNSQMLKATIPQLVKHFVTVICTADRTLPGAMFTVSVVLQAVHLGKHETCSAL